MRFLGKFPGQNQKSGQVRPEFKSNQNDVCWHRSRKKRWQCLETCYCCGLAARQGWHTGYWPSHSHRGPWSVSFRHEFETGNIFLTSSVWLIWLVINAELVLGGKSGMKAKLGKTIFESCTVCQCSDSNDLENRKLSSASMVLSNTL